VKILVACEESGIVRETFRAAGFDCFSCDLIESSQPSPFHIQDDVLNHLEGWDLIIAHPPCTYLTVSANKWMKPEYKIRFPDRAAQREEAADFFMRLYNAPCQRVAVENPIGVMSSRFRKPNQVLQPFQYGHPERKATCLWLRGLPNLVPTNIVALPQDKAAAQRLHYLPPSTDRTKLRSKTFQGIADAMVWQWGVKLMRLST
jgi:hypothetical protein